MRKYFSFKKITLLTLATLMVTTSSPNLVSAADDLGLFSTNDIIFYSSEKSCVAGSAGSLVAGDGTNPKTVEEVKKVIWGFLLGKGLTPEQTAGLMGNIQQESGFRPEAVEGGNGIGFGIVQWSFGRRTAVEAAAQKQGVPATSLAFQLEYMFQESNGRKAVKHAPRPELDGWPGSNATGSEWEVMKLQPNIRDATLFWHANFEVSGDDAAKLRGRVGFANAIFAEFNGKVGATGSAQCGVVDNSSLLATVKSYAWPEYHPPVYVTAKPEYVTALNRARAEGRYIGGTLYPGIDCGGFVTTVMIDSKFEPDYNFKAKGNGRVANTEAQEEWLNANWDLLGKGNAIDTGTLQAGDVAMLPGHTYMYIGDKGNKPEGFGSVIASASWDERAPMAGTENIAASNTTWFRKKAPSIGRERAE
jgi:hypothetical protein